MWQAVGGLVVVAGILFSAGSVGYKMANGKWQPVYYELAKQMTKLQADLNLKNEISKTETAKLGTELVIIAKDSELDYEKMQREVDRRVNDYLDKLAVAGLQPVPKAGDTGSNSNAGTMPLASSVLNIRNDEARLNRSLVEIERGLAHRILRNPRSSHNKKYSL